MKKKLLEINHLSIRFPGPEVPLEAVKNNSFVLYKGEILGIVGESGSGKSITALSIIQLLPKVAHIHQGSISLLLNDAGTDSPNSDSYTDLPLLTKDEISDIRGRRIAMIFQEPMTALNPVLNCGEQVQEAVVRHQKLSSEKAKQKTLDLFAQVKLPDPERIYRSFPHQLSGGQKQRVMIAMALSCQPDLLIADEPTTALDATVQKSILQLLLELKETYHLSMIFISHDLGVIQSIADRVLVMQEGKIVERGNVKTLFGSPQHPYTKGLLACRPSLTKDLKRLPTIADFIEKQTEPTKPPKLIIPDEVSALSDSPVLLSVKNLATWYPVKKNFMGKPLEYLKAVDNVSFELRKGETLGLVGESGCGKSTLAKTLIGLERPQFGNIWYEEKDLANISFEDWKQMRKKIQIIFQDPYSSLNPAQPIGLSIIEPMKVHRLWKNEKQYKEKAIGLLELVGLNETHFFRLPHEFSGGQRQRICIARALSLQPEFIICDECVSALDVSVQAQILNLLTDLKEQFKLTYIFISHDLSVVRFISDRVMVMKEGKIVESGTVDAIYSNPQSPHTRELISAVL